MVVFSLQISLTKTTELINLSHKFTNMLPHHLRLAMLPHNRAMLSNHLLKDMVNLGIIPLRLDITVNPKGP
jgi:hypothetical protein